MNKKKVKVVEYNNHPEMEGDEMQVAIMNNEKIKPKMKNKIAPRKPKQPRMTVTQLAVIVGQQGTKLDQLVLVVNTLAVEMRAGFAAVNQKIDKEVSEIKETLKRHEEILMRHDEILKRHDLIFERNNLK
jgi:exosome complex RNA-binding protein Csl4